MFLLLAGRIVLRHPLCGRVGQGSASLRFQLAQLVEQLVPLVVRHALCLTIVIGVRSLIELTDERLHPAYLFFCHILFRLFVCKITKSFVLLQTKQRKTSEL